MNGYDAEGKVLFTRPYIPRKKKNASALSTHKLSANKKSLHAKTVLKRTFEWINCRNIHSFLDKNCPVLLEKQELVAIKVTERVDHKTALSSYLARHNSSQETSYSQTIKNAAPTASPTKMLEAQPQKAKENKANANSIDDLLKVYFTKLQKLSTHLIKVIFNPIFWSKWCVFGSS